MLEIVIGCLLGSIFWTSFSNIFVGIILSLVSLICRSWEPIKEWIEDLWFMTIFNFTIFFFASFFSQIFELAQKGLEYSGS